MFEYGFTGGVQNPLANFLEDVGVEAAPGTEPDGKLQRPGWK